MALSDIILMRSKVFYYAFNVFHGTQLLYLVLKLKFGTLLEIYVTFRPNNCLVTPMTVRI